MNQLDGIRNWLIQQAHSASQRNLGLEKKQGFSVFFEGSDDSRKLSTAQGLAREFGKEIHHINLSQVVSKYIGETEKNIDVVFKKAEGKDWILFFDEADAMFGKRTDVKDAHDRYANIEVNYLLQKMESYPGLVILTAKHKENIDQGFIRRFNSILHFPID